MVWIKPLPAILGVTVAQNYQEFAFLENGNLHVGLVGQAICEASSMRFRLRAAQQMAPWALPVLWAVFERVDQTGMTGIVVSIQDGMPGGVEFKQMSKIVVSIEDSLPGDIRVDFVQAGKGQPFDPSTSFSRITGVRLICAGSSLNRLPH